MYNILCRFVIDREAKGCISFLKEELSGRRYTLCQRFGLQKEIRQRLGEVKRIFWSEAGCRLREAVKVMLEEGLSGEMVEQLEVGHYERSVSRRYYRNGHSSRCLRSC